MKNETICECGHIKFDHKYIGDWADDVVLPPRACTYCDCGNYKQDEATAQWWNTRDARDEMLESCDYISLQNGYGITITFTGKWDVADNNAGGLLIASDFDTPEAAFAWLKDHLKEQK